MADRIRKEDLTYDSSVKVSDTGKPILGRLSGPCADIINPTRNGRRYSNELWEKVFSNPIVKEYFENGGLPGELDHPEDRQAICSEKIAIMMPEPPKKNGQGELIGTWDILDTPNGRILHTLCEYGYKIGISSRGSGEVIPTYDGNEDVDADSYEFSCFDAVLLPSVKAARMNYVAESLESKPLAVALNEALNQASEDERRIMQESIDKLHLPRESAPHVNHIEDSVENIAVGNAEANAVLELQESVKKNKELNQQVIELQEKLSVSYAKEMNLSSQLDQYKASVRRLSADSKRVLALQERLKGVEGQLTDTKNELRETKSLVESATAEKIVLSNKMKVLQERLGTQTAKVGTLNEKLTLRNEKAQSDTRLLTEQLAASKKDLEMKKNEYSKKLSSANTLVEKYKKIANSAVTKYIESKAIQIGVSTQEITNRLAESYSFEDIDKVCADLRSYNVNMSKLPFQQIGLNEGVRAKISTNPKNAIVPRNEDDEIDSTLLQLAGMS